MTGLEKEIYQSIKFADLAKLRQLGAEESASLGFEIEISKGVFYPPILVAACRGDTECLKLLLRNKTMNINASDRETGVNAFWTAAFYGHGDCLSVLANTGINIFSKHKELLTNALHVSILNKHYEVALQLINSGFPVDQLMQNGFPPLMLSAQDVDAYHLS